jgi:hypothetical protein
MQRRNILRFALGFVAATVGVARAKAASPARSPLPGCGIGVGVRTQRYLKPAKRFPKLPERSSFTDPRDLAGYDTLVGRLKLIEEDKGNREIVGGLPYGQPVWTAFAVSPDLGASIHHHGRLLRVREGVPNSFSNRDHQMIDMTLALDSGYYALLGGHVPEAVKLGVRIGAIEALRDHRDDLLHPDEYQLVEFIRAVRDGTMTDDIWERMKKRFGTERAVADYVHYILSLEYHQKYWWAFGVPEVSREDLDKMLADFKSGAREPKLIYGGENREKKLNSL